MQTNWTLELGMTTFCHGLTKQTGWGTADVGQGLLAGTERPRIFVILFRIDVDIRAASVAPFWLASGPVAIRVVMFTCNVYAIVKTHIQY